MSGELTNLFSLLVLLHSVPTANESWVTYSVPSFAPKARVKEVGGYSQLDFVQLKVAGMPSMWKIINLIIVFVPKALLFKIVCTVGVNFLMDTAGILDLVLNSCALGFIAGIDELIFDLFLKDSTKYIMDNLESFQLYETGHLELYTDDELIAEFNVLRNASWRKNVWRVVPMRFIMSVACTAWFVWSYYNKFCQQDEEGTMISKPMHLPKTFSISILHVLFPRFFPADVDPEPFWTP